MAARLALVLSAAFLCLMLGLVSAPATPAVVAPAHPLRLAALRLDPPAEEAASAATALAGAAPRPPSPAGAPATRPRPLLTAALPPPPPPPPPGPDAVLRRSVAAVTEDGGRLSLVLAGGGRRLRAGESFMGWTVASVSRAGAVLSRGGARREVSFFAPSPASFAGPLLGPAAGIASAPSLPAGGSLPPVALPPPRSPAPRPAPPTAAEFFRGFKG